MDVTRILSRRPGELAASDIAAHAAEALTGSRVRTVHVLGRRGPVQGAFTTPELRELGELPEVDVLVDPADLVLDPVSAAIAEQGDDRTLQKNLEVLREWSTREPTGAPRRIVFHFNVSPVAVLGSDRVTGVQLVRNRMEPDGRGGVRAVATDTMSVLDVGLVFRSVGYRGVALDGLPFDAGRGVMPHRDGRVVEHEGSSTPLPGCYACGWIKRGPSGVIGTNKSCAVETIDALLADVAAERLPQPERVDEDVVTMLHARGVRVTDWADWQRLDALEVSRGAAVGKPREKLTDIAEMLAALS